MKFLSVIPLTPFFSHKPCGFYCVALRSMVVFTMHILGSMELTVHLCSKTDTNCLT